MSTGSDLPTDLRLFAGKVYRVIGKEQGADGIQYVYVERFNSDKPDSWGTWFRGGFTRDNLQWLLLLAVSTLSGLGFVQSYKNAGKAEENHAAITQANNTADETKKTADKTHEAVQETHREVKEAVKRSEAGPFGLKDKTADPSGPLKYNGTRPKE
jgi:hypothetical protein